MAATQAEPQLNEVNRDSVQQEQPPDLGNSGLQNGTVNKNNSRMIERINSDVGNARIKLPVPNPISIEMSQYRPESGPSLHNSEQNSNNVDEVSNKVNNSESKLYPPSSEPGGGGDPNYAKLPPEGQNMSSGYGLAFAPRGGYNHPDQHNSSNMPMMHGGEGGGVHQNNSFGQFIRHAYQGSKPMPGSPRPQGVGPNMAPTGAFSPHGHQSRFMSGQSISQPSGPTPTLNQLLQSSNPVHRYQNNYGEYSAGMQKSGDQPQGNMPYNQVWPPPRSMAPYGPQQGAVMFRNQSSNGPGRGGPAQQQQSQQGQQQPQQQQQSQQQPPPSPQQYLPQSGAPSPGPSPIMYPQSPSQPNSNTQPSQNAMGQQYPYPQKYSNPPNVPPSGPQSRSPYPSHQLNPPFSNQPPSQQSPHPPQHQSQQSQQQQQQQHQQQQQQQHQQQQQQHQQQQQQQPQQQQSQSQSQQQPQQSPQQSQSGNNSSSSGGFGPSGDQRPWPTQQQHPPSPVSGPGPPQNPSPHPPPQQSPIPQSPPPQQYPPPSPQHQQPHQSPQHQPHQSPQHQSFPSRPQSSPNPHAPDTGDLTGQNSNDSCSGAAGPGTPNSQGMRPTPSPTGSSGSRSMSPAVGQQNIPMPPRPQSGQSEGASGPPSRLSHSPMGTQAGGYQQSLAPPHMHNYKMGGPGGPPYSPQPPQQQQYPPGNYGPRPPGQLSNMQQYQGYAGQSPQPNNMGGPPNSPYPPRPLPNHVPHSQFSGYQQGWSMNQSGGGPASNHMPPAPPGGKGVNQQPPASPQQQQGGAPPQQPQPQQQPQQQQPPPQTPGGGPSPRSHTPPHYLKQHLQHKGGYASGMPPSPGPGGYGMGPPMGPPPPHGMAPPSNSHHDGSGPPMPPPSSTPSDTSGDLHESIITTPAGAGGGVTSVVTTGPDGAPMDEASQQSTLSNASAASGEDPSMTPKRKESNQSMFHPSTPQGMPPCSPGAASINSMHEDYPPDSSPTGWPRTPASPVFNSHVPQDLYRPKKHDSLSKLYEMDDSAERRIWLDKLLQFMDERGTPISACPTISKNPLDLFRLYLFVKERGGFMEVCKVQCSSNVTKNKVWKDIAGMLNIGASSSAAYTLRKHYTKNLLPFECHFDRGGIDPQPIINQVEASSKKKGAKNASVPSPAGNISGSSNSQDSFPASTGGSMDGYGYGYPPDYNNQRPPSQGNQAMQPGYQAQPGYQGQYPDQYGQQYPPGSGYPPRPMYPPYGQDNDRGYSPANNSSQPPAPNMPPQQPPPQPGQTPNQDPYRSGGYMPGNQQPTYPPRSGFGGPSPGPQPATPPNATSATQQPPGSSPAPPGPYPAGTPPQQDYYRPDQNYPGNQQPPGAGAPYPGAPPSKVMPPPAPQPRRHPDFAKDQQSYPPYSPQRPMYPGWTNSSSGSNNQFRGTYPGGGAPPPTWGARPGAQPQGQWDQQCRFPPPNQPPYIGQQSGQWIGTPGSGRGSPLRQERPGLRPESKPFAPMPPPPSQVAKPGQVGPQAVLKRELVFPPDSVEAVTPVVYKRRRLAKSDVAPVDAWRIMMGLRSGLLAETTWALDVLNILLYDDVGVQYFGLAHLPGLLDILLEHFRYSLTEMLDNNSYNDKKWYERPTYNSEEPDLGRVWPHPDPADRVTIFLNNQDYTMKSRKGSIVTTVNADDDIFVTDGCRSWDVEEGDNDDTAELESKYIIPCFKGEFGLVPFVRILKDVKKEKSESSVKSETMETSIKEEIISTTIVKQEISDDVNSEPSNNSNSSCKSDEISRTKTANKLVNSSNIINKDNVILDEAINCNTKDSSINSPKSEDDDEKERINDPAGVLKRRRMSDFEDESYARDESSLFLVTESQDAIARRCISLSTILRNLTFVPGNENEFSKNTLFLSLIGKLLLQHHEHPLRTYKARNYDREEDSDCADCCSSLHGESEWWWEYLQVLRENVLVCAANIAGQVDLGSQPEDISRPILDGLLHWAICPAAMGQDGFPTAPDLSPQRLALEALCKLCVTDSNVDLVVATPPYSRLERLASVLTKLLCHSEEQVMREFAVNLLHYLSAADSGMARTIALQSPCVSLLVAFIEQAEQSALGVATQHGISALRDNPDSMGTSLDMLRRAARTLLHLSRHPANRPLFLQQEQRLLALVMSQILDQQVAALVARVLYQCSRPTSPACSS